MDCSRYAMTLRSFLSRVQRSRLGVDSLSHTRGRAALPVAGTESIQATLDGYHDKQSTGRRVQGAHQMGVTNGRDNHALQYPDPRFRPRVYIVRGDSPSVKFKAGKTSIEEADREGGSEKEKCVQVMDAAIGSVQLAKWRSCFAGHLTNLFVLSLLSY